MFNKTNNGTIVLKDYINLNLIDLTEIINESFNILKCLIYTDSNKKDNINLVINIDKNLPKLIKNDGKIYFYWPQMF